MGLSVGSPPTAGLSAHGATTARCRSAAHRQPAVVARPADSGWAELLLFFLSFSFFKKCVWFFGRTGHIRSRIEMIQTSKLLVSTSLTTLMLNILSEKIIFMDERFWLK